MEPFQEFLVERQRELLVYSAAMSDVLNPVAETPNWDNGKTILTGEIIAVLPLAFSFAQAGI